MLRFIFLLFFCLLVTSSTGFAGEPEIDSINLRLLKKQLVVSFIVRNNTDKPIWVCQDIDSKGKQDYRIEVDRRNHKISVKFTSILVPPHILLEEPIWGKYTKLEPKAHLKKIVKLALPLTDTDRFSEQGGKRKKSISYIDKLTLEVGYYDNKIINSKETCCRNDSNAEMVFVSCFWAEKNKEYSISTQKDNLRLPFY